MSIALVASYGDVWNTSTTPKTASVTVANGDCLVVIGMAPGNTSAFGTPTGGALTYALQTSANTQGTLFMWTTFPGSGQSFTLSVTDTSGFTWGFIALRYTGVASIGAKTSRSDGSIGTCTTPITTTVDHSAIVTAVQDHGAGTAATWSTATAGSFTQSSTNGAQAAYAGTYLDSGTAGAKTAGFTTPSGATNTVGAIELVPSVVAAAVKSLIVESRAALVNAYHF